MPKRMPHRRFIAGKNGGTQRRRTPGKTKKVKDHDEDSTAESRPKRSRIDGTEDTSGTDKKQVDNEPGRTKPKPRGRPKKRKECNDEGESVQPPKPEKCARCEDNMQQNDVTRWSVNHVMVGIIAIIVLQQKVWSDSQSRALHLRPM